MQQVLNDNLGRQRLTMHERGICVVIPTYNNVGTIRDVVARAKVQCDDVIVVCDGATDGTLEVLRSMEGIVLVEYPQNAGKGEALRQGFRKALAMGFAYAITLDADGQHFPEDMHLFLDANMAHPGALIVGERQMQGADRSAGARFANSFSNFWFCVQTLHYMPDTQSGYRLYPLHKLRGMGLLTSRYEAELELMVFASWHGVPLRSIPISVYYPPRHERVSHFRPVPDFTRIFLLNTVLCMLALVYALPLALFRMLRTACYTLYAILFYVLCCLCMMMPAAFVCRMVMGDGSRYRRFLHKMLYGVTRFVVRIHGIPGVRCTVDNRHGEEFKRPSVVICNHQSFLDLMLMLSLSPNLIVLTNDWVWHSPFYGYVLRGAAFYPVSEGMENFLPKLEKMVDEGYSIVVYPEGTRSADGRIKRFHQGAFHIAERLGLDIVPMIEYGANHVLPKRGKYLRRGNVHLQIDRRYPRTEYSLHGGPRQVCRWFRKYYVKQMEILSNRFDRMA